MKFSAIDNTEMKYFNQWYGAVKVSGHLGGDDDKQLHHTSL
jgi:hypothetical protein